MTITSTLMEIGDWRVDLDPATPGAILDRLADWYAFLIITPQRVPPSAIPTRPLYRGVYLDRTGDGYTLGGADMAWYLGEPSDELTQSSGAGPWISTLWNTSTAVTSFLADITAKTGLSGVRRTGTPTSMVVSGINGTPRTALDGIAVDRLGCEWRVRTDAVLELYMASVEGVSPVAVIVDDASGREPGSTLAAWHLADTTPDLSVRDRHDRQVVRYGDNLTSATASLTWPKGYGGVDVERAAFSTFSGEAADVSNYANKRWVDEAQLVTALSVEIDDYAPLGQLANPDYLPGSAVAVHMPRLGVYDTANPMPWRGATIFPRNARVTEVTWPITRGMGVYLDNTHQGGGITDLTDWVAWESDGAGSGQTTKLTLGALPRTVTGDRRLIAV